MADETSTSGGGAPSAYEVNDSDFEVSDIEGEMIEQEWAIKRKEKIKKKNLHDYFPEIPVEKGNDFDTGVAYIRDQFVDKFNGYKLYPYVTCAVDTKNCERVFATVQDTVITHSIATLSNRM